MLEIVEYSFIRNALAAGLVVGTACSFLSVFIVLKRVVFVGITIAQISTVGVGVAVLFGLNPTLCALAFSLGAVTVLGFTSFGRRIPGDAVIGTGYVAAAAAAVLIMAMSPIEHGRMLNILFGNILTVDGSYLFILAASFSAAGIVHLLFYKQFYFCTFDPEAAYAFGYNARFWEIVLYLTIGVVISLSIRAVGALLCFGFLVVPAVAGLLLARRLRNIFIVAVLTAAGGTVAGMIVSFEFDLPSGPVICVFLVLIAMIAKMIASLRA